MRGRETSKQRRFRNSNGIKPMNATLIVHFQRVQKALLLSKCRLQNRDELSQWHLLFWFAVSLPSIDHAFGTTWRKLGDNLGRTLGQLCDHIVTIGGAFQSPAGASAPKWRDMTIAPLPALGLRRVKEMPTLKYSSLERTLGGHWQTHNTLTLGDNKLTNSCHCKKRSWMASNFQWMEAS